MVAVGSLKKIWNKIPEYASEEEFTEEFCVFFMEEWHDVLDAVDKSYAYNSYNTIYFSVVNIEVIENMNIDQLMKNNKFYQAVNIVVS